MVFFIKKRGELLMSIKKETNNINATSKKKILYIVECLGGGVFTYIVDLANHLCNEFDISIAYATRSQTPENYKDYFDKKIRLVEVKNFTRSINPIKDLKAIFEVKKIVQKINPDIIHCHSSKAGAITRFLFNGKDVPVFYTPHGYGFLMKDVDNVKRFFYKAVELILGKKQCTTIACSKGEYDESVKLTKYSTYINNGINTKEIQKFIDRYDSNTNKSYRFTVFTLGRICYQKNPELFNKIAEKLPDVNFLWIGDGELRDKLTSPNIKITGWLPREKALEYSMKADMFVLSSLWEGLPISLLESMYMKKICAVSDVIGNRDVIRNGVNGFVCKSADEFTRVIKCQKKYLDQSIVEKAYQDILDEYNTTVMGEKYKSIYEGKVIS
jgi:glycosyltransferase involved in cell wall biosynthesis